MNRKIKFRAWDSVHNRIIYSDKHLGYMPFDDNCFCNYDFNISKKGALLNLKWVLEMYQKEKVKGRRR